MKKLLKDSGRDFFALKFDLRMKLTALLIFISLFALQASETYGQKTKITLDLDSTVDTFIDRIEETTRFRFVFKMKEVKLDRAISIDVRDKTIDQVLDQVFKGTSTGYRVLNRRIYLTEKPSFDINQNGKVMPVATEIQNVVSGTVTDQDGNPLPGASIVEKGTTNGTTTDFDGRFSINITGDTDVLLISFIGYVPKEVPISGSSTVNIQLLEDVSQLDDVVVVGYGTQAGRDVTGSVSTVPSRKLKNFQVGSFTEALIGVVPGVQISQTTGDPGAPPSIRVRGVGSITAGNEPLYVIDGFPLGREAISNFNMNDIASISILKDASATSIYGSRGSNGVVLITTQRGEKGAPRISLEVFSGLQEITKKLDLLSPEEFVEFSIDAKNNAWEYLGNDPNDPNDARPPFYQISPYYFDTENWRRTDWQDEIFRVAPIQNYQLSVSGGSESVRYLFSGNYFNQQGIIENSYFRRYSIRSNIDLDLTDRLRLSNSLSASKVDNKRARDEGQLNQGVVGSAISLPGFFGPINEDGSYPDFWGFGYGVSSVRNPNAFINEYDDQRDQFRLLGNISMEYDILEGLYVKSYLGFDYQEIKDNSFQNSFDFSVPEFPEHNRGTIDARGSHSSINDFNWIWENTLHYGANFNENHKIDALMGITGQRSRVGNSFINATNFPDNLVPTLNAGQITGAGTSVSEWSILSYLARVNYGFKDRYFATATIRRDGSSRFGEDRKWGYFPSISLGWIVSEEGFLKDSSLLSFLKLRTSYGVSGNNAIPNYGPVGLLSYTDYVIGDNTTTGLVPSTLSNSNLSWERTRQVDIGLELGLLKNRIRLTADAYKNINEDLLLDVPVPSILGVTNALQNIGRVRNLGLEFLLSTQNLVGRFSWSTDFNISFNRNKVLALGPSGDPIRSTSNQESNITQVGRPVGDFYGYVFEGVYNSMEEINSRPSLETDRPGDPIVKDVNGDGEITVDDRTVLGNYQPDFFYGLENSFSYGNFDLSIIIQGVQGGSIMNLGRRQSLSMNGRTNNLGLARERWRSPEEPGNGEVFSASSDIRGVRRNPSSFYIEDGSYLRVRNITLGYNLNTSLSERIGIKNARIYISSQNPITITDYSGYNPEVSSFHNSLTPGVDYFNYPLAKTITLGVNLTF